MFQVPIEYVINLLIVTKCTSQVYSIYPVAYLGPLLNIYLIYNRIYYIVYTY